MINHRKRTVAPLDDKKLIYNEASDSVEKERRIINDRRKIFKVKHKMTALVHITFNEKF